MSVHDKYVYKVIVVMHVAIKPCAEQGYSFPNKYLPRKLFSGITNHHFSFSTSHYFQYEYSGRTIDK